MRVSTVSRHVATKRPMLKVTYHTRTLCTISVYLSSLFSGLVMGRRWWAGPSMFDMMGRGPARPVHFSEDGPRPDPAHQLLRRWAAAGPAHHVFNHSRPSPVHHFFKRLGPARPGPSHGSEAHETRALNGPAHVLSRTKGCMCIR